jgi:micrococcal nuclease
MLNEEIVARGYAVLLTIPPNIRHTERFRRALDASRAARRGLWADAQPW